MIGKSLIDSVHELAAEISEQNARIRELTAQAASVLKQPRPDTFLGRKTHEPFPKEQDFRTGVTD
ncbi:MULTISPECIES: hypothetical protein [Bradyrhizobium]|uniref:Uncharacterized protein n=1 Tax=Bradyrhizobium arachidis TaxID=858423 RepID=A0AAE7P081_9BRAD|nr:MULTISPECIES: hypothetical protein [Bradyrhizobium]QOG18606.1 hypothetical protein FOM02_15930 [Bradyrhizobium sp. SEMIA]QOZ73726.1 hypothetical protein WN72_34105 [Bradyrhizobium arachidis]UFW47203.1 hypothetical protein BaraCB756_33770 [Bradyrhizobium arachidis]SFU95468.1 hypothetical protein SAMN05192541_10887 [Bradyrhizobium arachidis]